VVLVQALFVKVKVIHDISNCNIMEREKVLLSLLYSKTTQASNMYLDIQCISINFELIVNNKLMFY